MSTCLDHKNGVRAKKRHRCVLCGEMIAAGQTYDRRSGVGDGCVWTMHMHPECHHHELNTDAVDLDWYEDVSDPAFSRADALMPYFDPCI